MKIKRISNKSINILSKKINERHFLVVFFDERWNQSVSIASQIKIFLINNDKTILLFNMAHQSNYFNNATDEIVPFLFFFFSTFKKIHWTIKQSKGIKCSLWLLQSCYCYLKLRHFYWRKRERVIPTSPYFNESKWINRSSS